MSTNRDIWFYITSIMNISSNKLQVYIKKGSIGIFLLLLKSRSYKENANRVNSDIVTK